MKNKSNNKKIKIGLLILLICITIGYAVLRTQLNINGIATIPNVSWDVHFENYQKLNTTNVEPTTEPSIPAESKTTTISYAVAFTEPGDLYEFTVDAVNAGTIDAMIESISSKLDDVEIDSEHPLPSYLDYSVTYVDGTPLQENQLLASNSHETYKVKIGFKDVDPSELPSEAQVLHLDLTVTYIQADDNAYPLNVDFQTSSWSEIAASYRAGSISQLQEAMIAGTTRAVPLDLNQDGTSDATCNVRIANISTPAECSTEGFSQTACGLVLECANVISTHVMNSSDRNAGGWPASEMRTYVNSDIYNSLPSNLKNKIISTFVVSSHGYGESTNYTSTDKLYLLNTKEVGFDISEDSAKEKTRVLDYYSANNTDTRRIKKDQNNASAWWWLRSAGSNHYNLFHEVNNNGSYNYDGANTIRGVSPAFRIG